MSAAKAKKGGRKEFELTEEQWKIVEESHARYLRGEGRTYTLEETMERARAFRKNKASVNALTEEQWNIVNKRSADYKSGKLKKYPLEKALARIRSRKNKNQRNP